MGGQGQAEAEGAGREGGSRLKRRKQEGREQPGPWAGPACGWGAQAHRTWEGRGGHSGPWRDSCFS